MPLPEQPMKWPPIEFDNAYEAYLIWDAWYTGDADMLSTLYATTRMQTKTSLWGQVRRRFWGTPTPTNVSQQPNKLHVPVASEIARMSASTLFEQMPQIRFPEPEQDEEATDAAATAEGTPAPKPSPASTPETAATDRLEELLDDEAHARFLEAAEFAAAHGGAFLRVTWDQNVVKDRPFLTTVPADAAIPEFRWGHLTGVTFWAKLAPIAGQGGVYMLLERHTPGSIEWGLYFSQSIGDLGRRVPLTEHPDAAPLAQMVGENATVDTGSELMTAVYIPNVQPNRKWRKDPVAKNLGRSDFDGAEDLMDALDEAYTSWMRDIRLAKTRIMVPKGMLTTLGAGNGATFNADQEVFTELGDQVGSLNPNAQGGNAESFIKTFQPMIRDKEHAATISGLLERVYSACGYSAQSFGDTTDTTITATESIAREKLTVLTRSSKIVAARPGIAHIAAALLDVDQHVFNGPGRPKDTLPEVEFPDAAAVNPEVMARTLQLLNVSESMSVEERVKLLHDDWTQDQVDVEVAKIKADLSMLPDPTIAHLWAAQADNASATGGVQAGQGGVSADPAQLAADKKTTAAISKQEAALNGPANP